MSPHAALVFAIGLTALCVICATCFLVWLLCALARDLYLHVTGRVFRVKYRDLNAHRITPRFRINGDAK
jgi:hypothetical protein